MTDRAPVLVGLAALFIGLVLLLQGCGATAIGTARDTIQIGAEAVKGTDPLVSRAYTDASRIILAESETIEEYRERIAPWFSLRDAQRTAIASLRSAESAIDTWEATEDERPFQAIIGCASRAVRRLVEAIRNAGIDVPPLIANTAEMLAQYLGAPCREGVTP